MRAFFLARSFSVVSAGDGPGAGADTPSFAGLRDTSWITAPDHPGDGLG